MSMLLIANHLQTQLLFPFLRWPNTTQLCLHSFHCCVPSILPLNIRPCLSYSPCLHCTDHPACAIHVTHSHCLHHPPHTPHPLLRLHVWQWERKTECLKVGCYFRGVGEFLVLES